MRLSIRKQGGLGHSALLLGLVVLAVVIGGGYYTYQHNQKQTAQKQAEQVAETERKQEAEKKAAEKQTIARTDKEQIGQALAKYCENQYRRFWEATYNRSFDPTIITSGYDDSVKDPFVIDGDYALIRAAKCDTAQLTELQKFAPFMIYFIKKDGNWTARERYQNTPPCADFKGETWPKSVLPECAEAPVPESQPTSTGADSPKGDAASEPSAVQEGNSPGPTTDASSR